MTADYHFVPSIQDVLMDKTGTSALKRNINRTLYCARMFVLLNILFCAAAVCLIVSKVFFGYDPDLRIYLWIVSGLTGVSAAGGLIAAWRSFYSYSDAALIFDYYGNYRHIFWIASSMPSEQGGVWLQKMEAGGAEQPRICMNRPLLLRKVLPALLLSAAALAVPVNEQAPVRRYSGTVIEEELAKKEHMAAELEKAGALSPEELAKIQKEIEKVRSRKSRRFSHERWEAIDGIGERIVNKARDTVGLKNWAGASARELAMHLKSGQRSVSRLAKKSEELAKALRTLAGQGTFTSLPPGLESVLGKNGSRLLDKNAPFDPKLLNNKELLKELDAFLSDSLSREKITKYLETEKEAAYRLCKKGGG